MPSVDPSQLTPAQLQEYNARRTSYFKGTIAVATIYGIIALGMFIIALVSASGRTMLTDTMFPFTLTFVIGIVIVIIMLLVAVFNAKPATDNTLTYDSVKCPDYWRLEQTPDAMLKSMDEELASRLKYRCVSDRASDINTLKTVTTIGTDTPKTVLLDKVQGPYQTDFTAPANETTQVTGYLNCNIVYPSYMNYVDSTWSKRDPDNPNALRCQYATECGVTWSSVCPNAQRP